MGPEFANTRPEQVVRVLQRAGFVVRRQTGSHLIMSKPGLRRPISIPMHAKDLPVGTVRAIITQAGLTVQEFQELIQLRDFTARNETARQAVRSEIARRSLEVWAESPAGAVEELYRTAGKQIALCTLWVTRFGYRSVFSRL